MKNIVFIHDQHRRYYAQRFASDSSKQAGFSLIRPDGFVKVGTAVQSRFRLAADYRRALIGTMTPMNGSLLYRTT